MISVRLPAPLMKRLNALASKMNRTKSYCALQAIEKFIEDREDYLLAVERLAENLPTYSLEEIIKKYGLETV